MGNKPWIKAIDTEHNGILFRSRLEARWAVFFDEAKIKYEYEPEGFEHEGIKYLPDFYFPDMDVYAEVKPDRPGIEEDILKCQKMIYWGGPIRKLVFLGNIPGPCKEGTWHFPCMYYDSSSSFSDCVSIGWFVFVNEMEIDDNMIAYPVPNAYGLIQHANYYPPFSITPYGDIIGRFDGFNSHYDVSLQAQSDKELDKKTTLTSKELMDIELSENPYCQQAFRKARSARFEFKR